MPESARITIHCPEHCLGCASCAQDFLAKRLPGKFKESSATISDVDVLCHGSNRNDIFVPVTGLSAIPQIQARHAVLRLIQCVIRNNITDDSIGIMVVDEDDVARLERQGPKYTVRDSEQPLLT